MAFKFESEPQEFLTEFRNGTNFNQNESEVSYRLRGNVGDLVQMRETVTVECIVNETQSMSFNYSATNERLSSLGLNFISEGLFVGATIQVIQGVNSGESTVENITGQQFTVLFLDTTNLGFLTDGNHTDIIIRVKDAPTYMRYQYGCIPDSVRSDSEENYASIDGNIQAYYLYDIVTPSYELLDMTRFGRFKGTDLTRGIQVAFAGTTDTYYHSYDIIHTFRISAYKDTEQENIINKIPPAELSKTGTLKYANKIFLGYDPQVVGSVTKLGVTGDVGYFDENYNGKTSKYFISQFEVTNSLGTGQLSANLPNQVSLRVTNEGISFIDEQKLIIQFFVLREKSQYTNISLLTYDEIFLRDSVIQIGDAVPVDSTIVKNVVVDRNAAFDYLTVTFDVEFTTTQTERLKSNDIYALGVSTGDENLPPDKEDNVTLMTTGFIHASLDRSGIIYDVVQNYYDSHSANSGDRAFTNQATWNGCFVGFDFLFKMAQTNDGFKNRITTMESRMVLVSDTNPLDYKVMQTKQMPLSPLDADVVSAGYSYQLLSGQSNDTNRLPSGEPLNFNQVRSLPSYPAGYQTVEVTGSVPRINWREWIENLDLPVVFFDPDEPNNNLNQKTSNYSGLNGYSVYHELYLDVVNSKIQVLDTKPTESTSPAYPSTITPYHLRSDVFEIIDFDLDGNPSVVFVAEFKFYDASGNEVDDFSSTQVRLIEAIIRHDQGTLPLNDLWGEIWIEPKNGTGEVLGQLHSSKDWSNALNPLIGSQEVTPFTNILYVEMVSNLNIVYLYCQTNPANLIPGQEYNIYGRLGKKTV